MLGICVFLRCFFWLSSLCEPVRLCACSRVSILGVLIMVPCKAGECSPRPEAQTMDKCEGVVWRNTWVGRVRMAQIDLSRQVSVLVVNKFSYLAERH